MTCINDHHLRYVGTVAREGSMARAAERLHLTQPTISTQIAQFEAALGQKQSAVGTGSNTSGCWTPSTSTLT